MNGKSEEVDRWKDLLKKVLTTQYFAVLSTLDGNVPYLNLVSFTVVDDMKTVIFATNRHTHKYHNIQENHSVSLLVDNRTNTPSDIADAVAVTLLGTAIDNPDNEGKFKDLFLSRHSHLKQFIEDPETTLILVAIREYIIARFDNVKRFATL